MLCAMSHVRICIYMYIYVCVCIFRWRERESLCERVYTFIGRETRRDRERQAARGSDS